MKDRYSPDSNPDYFTPGVDIESQTGVEELADKNRVTAAAATEQGKRSKQEDSFIFKHLNRSQTDAIGIIADGFSGGGEVSAKFINFMMEQTKDWVDVDSLTSNEIKNAVWTATGKLADWMNQNPVIDYEKDEDIRGTTFSIVLVGKNKIFAANAGDSPILACNYATSDFLMVEPIYKDDSRIYEAGIENEILAKKLNLRSAASNISNGFRLTRVFPNIYIEEHQRKGIDFIVLGSDGIRPPIQEGTTIIRSISDYKNNLILGIRKMFRFLDLDLDQIAKQAVTTGSKDSHDNATILIIDLRGEK